MHTVVTVIVSVSTLITLALCSDVLRSHYVAFRTIGKRGANLMPFHVFIVAAAVVIMVLAAVIQLFADPRTDWVFWTAFALFEISSVMTWLALALVGKFQRRRAARTNKEISERLAKYHV